jgi:hypothetical protein
VSDGSTDNTVLRLRRAGWRCLEEPVNRRKPGCIAQPARSRCPLHISTVMVIDPDIRIRGLETPAAALISSASSAISSSPARPPRVRAS